jgi:hypothetical protein
LSLIERANFADKATKADVKEVVDSALSPGETITLIPTSLEGPYAQAFV